MSETSGSEIEKNADEKEPLTRAERKKLKRQEFKGEQNAHREAQRKSRLYKKIGILSISALILIGIGYFVLSAPKTEMPTVDDDPIIGELNAPLTIIEFGDFKCPYTKQFNTQILPALLEKYGDKIKIVYRDMPTGRHGDSITPAMAAECANEQGRFKEYHNLLFANQQISDKLGYTDLARKLTIDINSFKECLNSNKYKDEVIKDYKAGKRARVDRTPTLFINGEVIQGIVEEKVYYDVINAQLLK